MTLRIENTLTNKKEEFVPIEKGKVNKAKAKTTLSKLKSNKTYYLRVRLIDGKGICSNWSKVIKCKTK